MGNTGNQISLIDRLYRRVSEAGNVCIGLDTDLSYIPAGFLGRFRSKCDAVFAFNKELIDATLDIVAAYKVQIAYYEALGLDGLNSYMKTLGYLRDKGAIVIADIKRGDIAKTAEMYAKAHFTGDFEADFITVNPFMGMDTLEPFFPYIKENGKGLFVLVATSNPGARDIEGIIASDGQTVSGKTGAMLGEKAKPFMADCGYSPIGAVVGCTNKQQTKEIRERLKHTFFLIPGYGAQGGTAGDITAYLDENANGGIVNSSRAILTAHKNPARKGLSFEHAARAEAVFMRDEIAKEIKLHGK